MKHLSQPSNNVRQTAPVVQVLEGRLLLCAELHGTAASAALHDGAAMKETLYEAAARPGPAPAPGSGFGFGGAFRAGSELDEGGLGIAVDADGNLYVASVAQAVPEDVHSVAKYSPLGTRLWSVAIKGRMALDTAGDVYVTGAFAGTMTVPGAPDVLTSAGGTDVFVVKLSSANGAAIWARRFGGTRSEGAEGIAVDGLGAYYVASHVPTDAGGTATVATKFDDAGNVVYTRERDAANPLTLPAAIALDRATGAVVVAGLTYSGSPRSSFAWKLDAAGAEQWDRQWAGALSSSYAQARGVTIDGSGNVLVAGAFSGSVDFNPSPTSAFSLTSRTCRDRPGGALYCQSGYSADAFVMKLGADGAFTWAAAMGGGARGGDSANDVATDTDGNVYTAGTFYDKADFDPGSERFEITAKGVSSGDWLSDEAGVSDAFISKLDAAGRFVWAAAVGGSDSASTGDSGNGIAIGDDQRVHATGFFRGSGDFDPTGGVRTLTSAGHSDLFVVSLTQPATPGTAAGGVFVGRGFGAADTVIVAEASVENEVMRQQLGEELEALLR